MAKVSDYLSKQRIDEIFALGTQKGDSQDQIRKTIQAEAKKAKQLQDQQQATKPAMTVEEALKDSIYTEDSTRGKILRGATTSGIRFVNLLDGGAEMVGLDLIPDKYTKVGNETLEKFEQIKQETSREDITDPKRLKELEELEQKSANAKGIMENVAVGAEQMIDVAANPAEWTLQGIVEGGTDIFNAASLGLGNLASKLGRTIFSKIGYGAAAGAVEGATINTAGEYVIAKGQNKSDAEAIKIAQQSFGGGVAAGTAFGAVGGAIPGGSPRAKKINKKINESVKDAPVEDILNNELLKAAGDLNEALDSMPEIKEEQMASIDQLINNNRFVNAEFKKESAGDPGSKRSDYDPNFVMINDNLPATLNELVEIELIDPKEAAQIEYKNKMLYLGHKDVIYADLPGWNEKVSLDIVEIVNGKKIKSYIAAEEVAIRSSDAAKEISHQLDLEGADAARIKEEINKQLLPTKEESTISQLINDGQPLENRFSGFRIREAAKNTMELPEVDPNELTNKLLRAGVSESLTKATVQSILNKDIQVLDDHIESKLLGNFENENKQLQETIKNELVPQKIQEDPAPDIKENTPEVKDPAPEVKDPAPEVKDPAPEVDPNNLENLQPIQHKVKLLDQTPRQRAERRLYFDTKKDFEKKIHRFNYEYKEGQLVKDGADPIPLSEAEQTIAGEIWDQKAAEDLQNQRFKNYEVIKGIDQDITYEEAKAAHSGTSFDPEKRAASEIAGHIETLTSDYENLLKLVKDTDQRDLLDGEFARYRKGYTDRNKTLLARKSRTYSAMIAGRSNFPVARMEKLNGYVHNAMGDLVEYRERALKAIAKKLRGVEDTGVIRSDDPKAILKLESKLENLQKAHELMKLTNKLLRSKKLDDAARTQKIIEAGYSEHDAKIVLAREELGGGRGFATYALQNSNANMKRVKSRIAQLKKEKEKAASGGAPDIEFIGGKIHENHELSRIQILFDDIPSEEIRSDLKAKGFRWSPKAKAWQRQLTNAGRWSAESLMEKHLKRKDDQVAAAALDEGAIAKYTSDLDPEVVLNKALETLGEC